MRYAYSMYSIVRLVHQRSQPTEALADVLTLWAEYQRKESAPNSAVLSSVVIAYSMLDMPNVAVRLFNSFPDVKLLRVAYRYALHSAEQANDVETIVTILNDMEESGLEVSRTEYEILLIACLKVNDHDRADAIVRHLESLGGGISRRVYVQLTVAAIAERNVSKAARCLEILGSEYELQPQTDVRLCDRLLGACIRWNDPSAAGVAIRLLDQMNRAPDRGTILALLSVGASGGHPEFVQHLMHLAEKSGIPLSAPFYESLLHAQAMSGQEHACVQTLTEMDSARLRPTAGTVRFAAQALVALHAGRPEDRVSRFVTDFAHRLAVSEQPPAIPVVMLVLEMVALRPMDRVRELVTDILDAGWSLPHRLPPDAWAAILDACAAPRSLDLTLARRVVQDMRTAGTTLSTRGFSALVRLLTRAGLMDKALEAFQRSAEVRAVVDRAAASELAKALARQGRPRDADDVLDKLEECIGQGMAPPRVRRAVRDIEHGTYPEFAGPLGTTVATAVQRPAGTMG